MLLQKFKKGAKEDTEEESENQLLQAGVEIVDERRSQLRSTSGETNVLPRVSREEQKKKLEDSEKYLPRGKRMVSASIQQERKKQKKKGETITASQGRKSKSSILVSAVPKPMESSEFKGLAAKNLIRKEWSRSIGSGTFDTYRGISVVIKQYGA